MKEDPFGAFWETLEPEFAEKASVEDHSEWVM